MAGLCGLTDADRSWTCFVAAHRFTRCSRAGRPEFRFCPASGLRSEANDCSATSQGRLIAQLKRLGAHADVVVVDTGSGRNSFVRRFWQAADMPLVVTTPEPVAIMDCYATIKVLLAGDASIAVRIAVNRATVPSQAAEVQTRIAAACRRFLGVRAAAAGHLPDEQLVSRRPALHAVRAQLAAFEAARAMEQLSEGLWPDAAAREPMRARVAAASSQSAA